MIMKATKIGSITVMMLAVAFAMFAMSNTGAVAQEGTAVNKPYQYIVDVNASHGDNPANTLQPGGEWRNRGIGEWIQYELKQPNRLCRKWCQPRF